MTTATELFELENPMEKITKALQGQGKFMSLSAIISALTKNEDLKASFLALSPNDIHQILSKIETKPELKAKSKLKLPTVRETEMEEYKKAILASLSLLGLNDGYGVSPVQLRSTIGRGSEHSMRTALKDLSDAGVIRSVGITKGLRYFMPEHAKEALRVYEELKKSREDKSKKE